jgi:hypothetical protein
VFFTTLCICFLSSLPNILFSYLGFYFGGITSLQYIFNSEATLHLPNTYDFLYCHHCHPCDHGTCYHRRSPYGPGCNCRTPLDPDYPCHLHGLLHPRGSHCLPPHVNLLNVPRPHTLCLAHGFLQSDSRFCWSV